MKLCQINVNGAIKDTYFPDELIQMYISQGIEATPVYNDNYLPASLRVQAA